MGHRPVSQAFANYIIHSPILHHHTSRHPSLSPESEKPLDLYIAHIIHASKVPEIVPYTALYLLASISQPCQCRIPHIKPKSNYAPSLPSKLSHILSQATTRTPFSRVAKSHWDERYIFIGAFYLSILAYVPVFDKEYHKELPYWHMFSICGISEEEIRDVSIAFQQCINDELYTTIRAMLWNKFVISVSEFDCPFALARQRRLEKASEDGNVNLKRRLSLKESIGSFCRLGEKASPVASDSKPEGSVDCGPNSVSDESWSW